MGMMKITLTNDEADALWRVGEDLTLPEDEPILWKLNARGLISLYGGETTYRLTGFGREVHEAIDAAYWAQASSENVFPYNGGHHLW